MKREIRILRRAQLDLAEIRSYVARDRPAAADRLVDRLLDALESLEEMPERGAVPRDERLELLGYRILVEQDYLAFYKVFRKQVRVYRVLSGRRRFGRLV